MHGLGHYAGDPVIDAIMALVQAPFVVFLFGVFIGAIAVLAVNHK